MSIRIYVEGGGNSRAPRSAFHEGFTAFFHKVGLEGKMPRVIPCGTRRQAYKDFCAAWELYQSGKMRDLPLLLVDSEAQVETTPWAHVKKREHDQWERPQGTQEGHLHFMAQCMEAWFLAGENRSTLEAYYGDGFNPNMLPRQTACEEIPKPAIFDSLEKAASQSNKKGYDKGRDSFKLLGKIDPQEVARHAPHGRRLLDFLKQPEAA